jgi:phage terminase large subunit GpA-like protein
MIATHPSARRAINEAARRVWRQRVRPRPRLTGSEWVERFLVLPSSTTRQAGRVRLSVTPYLRDVLDAVTDRHVQQVTFIAPSQSAKTTFVLAVMGYYIHQEPSPTLAVQPTVEMAEDFSKGRFTPTLEASPALRKLIAAPRSRQSANTILSKQYPGGQADFAGANSPAGLASRPKRLVLFDEVDRYPAEAGTEGDPIKIGVARTTSYQRSRKIVVITSPTDEPEEAPDGRWYGSRGWREYVKGSMEVWEVACPACGHWQVLDFDRLRWEAEGDTVDRESVHYPCASCEHPIRDSNRPAMPGRWRATNPSADPTHRSFHLEGLSAAFALWDELAKEFREVNKDPVLFKTFVNTKLGRLWKDRRIEGLKDALRARAKRYAPDGQEWAVPREAALLTAGVDVQHDRLELVVRAWGVGEESWLVERAILRGDTSQPHVWATLEEYRAGRTWKHELGARLRIRAMCVDAGDGSHAKRVYDYCAPRRSDGVYAVKGHGEFSAPILPRKPTVVKPGKLWVIGVNAITERIYRRLNMTERAAGYLHLNEYADDDYVSQLLSEERVTDPKTRKRRFVPRRGTRNEVLDCEKYAYAALHLSPVPIASLAAEVDRVAAEGEATQAPVPVVTTTPPPARSSWVGGTRGGGKWV